MRVKSVGPMDVPSPVTPTAMEYGLEALLRFPAASLDLAVKLWLLLAHRSALGVKVKLPGVLVSVAWPIRAPLSKMRTVLPVAAVTVSVGRVSLVTAPL